MDNLHVIHGCLNYLQEIEKLYWGLYIDASSVTACDQFTYVNLQKEEFNLDNFTIREAFRCVHENILA